MSVDFEQQFRAQMERAEIRPRPDVVRDAYRRFRIRRRAARAALAAGTALAAGVAMLVLTSTSSDPDIETTGYVVSQMNSALTAADDDIMSVYQVGVDYPGTPNAFSIHYWFYGSQSRMRSVYGGVEQDSWDTVTRVKQGTLDTEVGIDYRQRIAVVSPVIIPLPPGKLQSPMTCPALPGGVTGGPGTGVIENASWLAGYMHALIGCGGVSATWNQRYHGTAAIKLTGHYGGITWRVWIDPATFLPIADGFSSTVASDGSRSDQYEWLPPTKANRAYLTGPIPHGFTVIHNRVITRAILGPPPPSATTPITPTTWGTGPAAAIARRMAGSLHATSSEIYVSRQVINGIPAQATTTWVYPGKTRVRAIENGKLSHESLDTTSPAGHGQERDISISVNYPTREVFRQDTVQPAAKPWGNVLPTPSRVCAMAAVPKDDPLALAAGWGQSGEGITAAVAIRDLLACPHISVAISWHQRFNGTEAIKIVWPRPAQQSTDTLWLNESTYALIGVTFASDPGPPQHQGNAVFTSSSIQLTWLPPTKANLALFTISIPRGFAGASG